MSRLEIHTLLESHYLIFTLYPLINRYLPLICNPPFRNSSHFTCNLAQIRYDHNLFCNPSPIISHNLIYSVKSSLLSTNQPTLSPKFASSYSPLHLQLLSSYQTAYQPYLLKMQLRNHCNRNFSPRVKQPITLTS